MIDYNETVKCVTCGSLCKIVGHTTKSYEPIINQELFRITALEAENARLRVALELIAEGKGDFWCAVCGSQECAKEALGK